MTTMPGWAQYPKLYKVAMEDRSGTISTGGTAQQLMAANNERLYLMVQNISAETLWIDFGATAVQSQPSIKLIPDAVFVMEYGIVSPEAISIIGPTVGQAFVAKEA